MKSATKEWIKKAEGDFQTALRESRTRKHPNYDAACFHAQQSVEKYLKAILTEEGKNFPKIHDLLKLSELCIENMPELVLQENDLDLLSRYAIAFRYPGESATKDDAKVCIRALRRLQKILQKNLK